MQEPLTPFDLSREQQDTATLVHRLLGSRMANRYVDFCRLAAGAVPLRVSAPLAAHALRELDSILRDTLEVPMEIAIEPSKEDLEKVNQAKAQLRAMGFSDLEVDKAAEQLRPRLTQKQEIEKIVSRLGLASDGRTARAWKSISRIHSLAHGGRALHQSFEVNDDFRAEWQAPFDTVMRDLMIALQGRYTALIRRIDQLAAMRNRGAAVTMFSREIPGALPLLWHFFNKLETPDWLPHLVKRKLLSPPPSPVGEPRTDGFLREWPAGSYLRRMAQSSDSAARVHVVDALRGASASDHPDVQDLGIEILAALPADEAAAQVDLAERWLEQSSRFVMAQAPHDLIRKLAEGGESKAALRVTRAVFRVFSENGRLATLFSQHMYEHHLPDAVKAIAPTCKVEAVALLADLLDQALRHARRLTDDPPSDYSYYISGEISEHGTKHDVMDALVGETVHAAKLAMDVDPDCMAEIIGRLQRYSAKLFTRIAMHVASLAPERAPDVAQCFLTDADLIEETWCRVEYGQLARAWFPSLPSAVQESILSCVDAIPDKYRDRFNQRFEEQEGRPPTGEEQRERDANIVRDIVWHWRDVLPAERREAAEKLGDPDAWIKRFDERPASPPGMPDFSTHPIEDIVGFLEKWRPSGEDRSETATTLGQQLREAAIADPLRYSTQSHLFAQLPPIYVRRLLEGLALASNNKSALKWTNLLALIEVVLAPEHRPAPSGMAGDDADWSWSLKAAMDLLASGLRRGAEGVPFEEEQRVESIILNLYGAAPRMPDTENFEESYSRQPHFASQSTARGAAVQLCIFFLYWLHKNPEGEIGRSPRKALEKLHSIRKLLDVELADRTETGRIPRAMLGRYLQWLQFFAEGWVIRQFASLFPDDDLSLRDAAWLGHLLGDGGPVSALASRMQACYEVEIDRLRDEAPSQEAHTGDRLAEYLVILYTREALPDAVFERFWSSAPARYRQHAVWFLGTQIEKPPEKLGQEIHNRAVSYWEYRLQRAKTSASPDHFRDEIGAFGQFFFRKGISDEWLLDQTLSVSEAGFAPSEPYSVIRRLAEISPRLPDKTALALASLIRNRDFNHRAYMVQAAEVRSILVNGLATRVPETTTAAIEAINYLAAMGDTRFIDVLPNPALKTE